MSLWRKIRNSINKLDYNREICDRSIRTLYKISKEKVKKYKGRVGNLHSFDKECIIETVSIDSFKFMKCGENIQFYVYNAKKVKYIKLYCLDNGFNLSYKFDYFEDEMEALAEYLGTIHLYLR